jgi:hypothetical protein
MGEFQKCCIALEVSEKSYKICPKNKGWNPEQAR